MFKVKQLIPIAAAAIGAVVGMFSPPAPVAAQTICSTSPRSVTFSAKSPPLGVKIRSGPGTNYPVIGSIPPNQVIQFRAVVLGQQVPDFRTGKMDARWYIDQNGYAASGAVDGNAPGSTPSCTSTTTNTPPPASNSSNANTPYLPFDPDVALKVTTGIGQHTGYGNHNYYALDFGAAGMNVNARATRTGVVSFAGWRDKFYGNVVEVRFNDGKYGIYEHLDQIYVSKGATVAGGQALGKIGNTGDSTGRHLHYMESNTSFGASVPLPRFADAPNFNFYNSGVFVTSGNPDNRR